MSVIAAQRNPNIVSATDALKYLGSFILFAMAWGIFYLGTGGWFGDPREALSYVFISLIGAIIGISLFIFYILDFGKKRTMNYGYLTIISLTLLIIAFFIPEPDTKFAEDVETYGGIALGGILILFVALRPNFGPEANKRIYQASAAIFACVIAVIILFLGFYINLEPKISGRNTMGFNIGDYAGSGRYPGDFIYDYISSVGGAYFDHYTLIKTSGTYLMIGAAIIIVAAFLRNKISLELASITIFAGIGVCIAGISIFELNWNALDTLFFNDYQAAKELRLQDPGITNIATVLVILEGIAGTLMLYASQAAKPIDKWRRRRDQSIAAAEVATREGRLPQAVKYLEAAALWSSKIDEEDKSIELLTRVKQIKDKAIKMKKAQAAEKAKKEYDRQQKAEKRKEAKPKPEKKQPKQEEIKEEKEDAPKGPVTPQKID
jgi:hypothetical protein